MNIVEKDTLVGVHYFEFDPESLPRAADIYSHNLSEFDHRILDILFRT